MAGIIHKRVVAPRDKGLAADWNDDHVIDGNIDIKQHQFLNQVIENVTEFPGGPVEGQIIYRTDENQFYIYNGTFWLVFIDDGNIPNHVAILTGTHYWSCPGQNFKAGNPDTDQIKYWGAHSYVYPEADGVLFVAPVFLPHGAVVTKAVVFGDAGASAKGWILYRGTLTTSTGVVMAMDNINTEDNTIANATIDNNNYCYFFATSSLDTNDKIYGARIIYTL